MIETEILSKGVHAINEAINEEHNNKTLVPQKMEQLNFSDDWVFDESVIVKKKFEGSLWNDAKNKFETIEASITTGDHDPYLTFKGKITKKDVLRVKHFLTQLENA